MLLDIIRQKDTTLLSKVATIKGFYQIYRDMIKSSKDPKRNLLHFEVNDIRYIKPVEVHIVEDGEKCKCDVDVFFMCMRYLDDVVKASAETKQSDLLIYRDIRNVESILRKGRKISLENSMSAPPSEKILFIEGYMRLNSLYSKINYEPSDWRIAFFKFSTFNIVPMNNLKK